MVMRKLFLAVLALGISTVQAGTETWQVDLGDENTWSRLTFAGTLLAATKSSLSHFDSASGDLLWKRDDLNKLAQFNVSDIAGTPFLIISERVGNIPPKSRLQVLNLSTGETLWDTGKFAGSGLGAYAAPDQNLLVYVADFAAKKPGVYVVGYALATGEELWRTKLASVGGLPTHPSDIGGFIPSPDLNGHPQPLFLDGQMILAAGDLFAIDLNDGSLRWRAKLKASIPNLKNTYAQPILAGDVLYAASKSSIHALNIDTGEELWKVKIGKAKMPQLELVGDLLVGRLGGTFSNGKKLVGAKPFGAFAVDTTSGKLVWKWTKAKDSLTNLYIMEEKELVVLADKKNLYALDLHASKKGKVVNKQKLEFKRKMGTADMAAKGLGIGAGFLGGGLAGGLKGFGGGGDRGDPPLDIERIGERIVVRAQYHVLSYNLGTKSTDWSIEFAPPGMSSFALIAMGAVTAVVAVERAGPTRAVGGLQGSRMLDSTLNITSSFQSAVNERFAAAEKAKTIAFFLTKEDEGMVLLGIDLATGNEVGRIPMAEKEPQFLVDDIGNRVYYFKDKTELLAYDF